MNAGGRGITGYRAEYDEQAYNYCLLGATNETLAEFFGVSATTIKKWMNKYPGFKESIRRGKDLADMEVARSLYRRAVGYSYEQVVTEYVRAADNQGESENVTKTVGTFMKEDSNSFQKISLTTIQAELEKVITMVGTFLNEQREGLQEIGLATIQGELEKVTHTVGTFLNEDSNSLQKSSVATTQGEAEKVTNTVRTFLDEEREGLQKIRVTTREVIPDVRAQIFWLKNRRPDLWRDKQEIDHKSGGEKVPYVTLFELPDDGRNPEIMATLNSSRHI